MKKLKVVMLTVGFVVFQVLSPVAMTPASQEEMEMVESLILYNRQNWEKISPASFGVDLKRMMGSSEHDQDPLYDTYHSQQVTRIDGERRLYQVNVEQDWRGQANRNSSGTIIYDGSRYISHIHGDGYFRIQEPSPLGEPEIAPIRNDILVDLSSVYLVTHFGLHGVDILSRYLAEGKILSCRMNDGTTTVRYYHQFPTLEEVILITDLVFSESNGYFLVQAIERWSDGKLFQELNCEYEEINGIHVPKQFDFTRYTYDKDGEYVIHHFVEAIFSDWKLEIEDRDQFSLEGLSRLYPDVRTAFDFITNPPVEINIQH